MIKIDKDRVVRRKRKNWFLIGGVFVAIFLFTFLTHIFKDKAEEVEAVNLANFDPGYIISDYQMGNYNSMNETEIQRFLKSKNSCNDTDITKYTVGNKVSYFSETMPPRTWHIKNGHFVCLADEDFNGESAAHIIYRAAQDYKINPQVLIVLLEKEQSLITDTFPHSGQYRSATGYGCPDTAACSSKYYGFRNQVRNAASLFRTVLDGGWTNYPLGNNYIQYNPSASCGGSVVNIRSLATSALYRYTPYQPNAATLGGWTDGCNAYGNLNFYKLFEGWFGGATQVQKSTRIAEGTYYIKTSSSAMYLDVESGSSENGASVQIYPKDGTPTQEWTITYNSDTDDYDIINAHSGKALDVYDADTTRGTKVQIWKANKTCAQRWKIFETSGEIVKLVSSCSDKVLDVSNGDMVTGNNIQIWDDNNTNAQKWVLVPVEVVEDGMYNIVSSISNNSVIDIRGGAYGVKNGTNIQIWKYNYTTAQKWYIERDVDGYYTIKNKQSGKVLDVSGAGTKSGTNVQAFTSNGTCAQKWRILKNGANHVFISACSHKVLDLTSAITSNGSNIQIYVPNGTNAQKWKLSSVSMIKEGIYNIVSKLDEEKLVDIAGGSELRGTNIQLYENEELDTQEWKVLYDEDTDYYTFLNEATNRVIDVDGAGEENGTNIQIWYKNDTCAQKWAISKVGDYYVLYSGCSGLVMDVRGAEIYNGTNIQLFTYNGTDAQKWLFR